MKLLKLFFLSVLMFFSSKSFNFHVKENFRNDSQQLSSRVNSNTSISGELISQLKTSILPIELFPIISSYAEPITKEQATKDLINALSDATLTKDERFNAVKSAIKNDAELNKELYYPNLKGSYHPLEQAICPRQDPLWLNLSKPGIFPIFPDVRIVELLLKAGSKFKFIYINSWERRTPLGLVMDALSLSSDYLHKFYGKSDEAKEELLKIYHLLFKEHLIETSLMHSGIYSFFS